jgi:hypothetical protein
LADDLLIVFFLDGIKLRVDVERFQSPFLGDLQARGLFSIAENKADLGVDFSGQDGVMDGPEVRAATGDHDHDPAVFLWADKDFFGDERFLILS